jgi:hypothetical protein
MERNLDGLRAKLGGEDEANDAFECLVSLFQQTAGLEDVHEFEAQRS